MTLPTYVLDACSLIHFERASTLRQLPLPESRTFVPTRVVREVNKPRSRLSTWLKRNPNVITQFVGEEGQLYLQYMRDGLDDGEAAALSIARHRQATLVTDDRAARSVAKLNAVRCITTDEYIKEAMSQQSELWPQ